MIDFRQGDCRDVLRMLPDNSVHCVVTSPPYFGLRDYGTATWEGGNDFTCNHKQGRPGAGRADGIVDDRAQRNRDGVGSMGGDCKRCGARRIDSQIGLEATPDAFVAEMVTVFREVRRVLRDDGTPWLNLGDSYAGGGNGSRDPDRWPKQSRNTGSDITHAKKQTGLKNKDLIGIPWRVAFALQADGWYLRQDIIWHKPNPMPESITDRCTKAHEYVFMFSKSPKYHYDHEAIKEPSVYAPGKTKEVEREKGYYGGKWSSNGDDKQAGHGWERQRNDGSFKAIRETRNKRSVWTVSPKPFKEAHFATFPPALIEPCILAGCPLGGTVLDPFGGAGTTGLVAVQHARNAILIELNADYIEIARRRIYGHKFPWEAVHKFPWEMQ